ncbi:hypothetical protein ColKHC_13214 [Colletotrichum higginsianum]|nr:hypothetical protein ColKHC_13214 [Colletotrichum higginsianum]
MTGIAGIIGVTGSIGVAGSIGVTGSIGVPGIGSISSTPAMVDCSLRCRLRFQVKLGLCFLIAVSEAQLIDEDILSLGCGRAGRERGVLLKSLPPDALPPGRYRDL